MNQISLGVLAGALVVLIILSAFFSSAETGMMALNRYRLRHMARQHHSGATRVSKLLERPDRLIGVILLGNNFVNILASSIATIIALRVLGEGGIALATALLTVVVLIFAEVTPKTLAALHPERVAFPASYVLTPLLKLLYPLVWLINLMANGLLRLLGVSPKQIESQPLTREELRTVVNEAGAMIPGHHRQMLVRILDMGKATVNDIMVPRHEIVGLDLGEPDESLREQLTESRHTRVLLYRGDIDNVAGIVHMRRAVRLLQGGAFSKQQLTGIAKRPYFVPSATPLLTQLLNFQRQQRRIGLVVDEYGEIEGLVTLEDILEEIVGEFTTDPAAEESPDLVRQPDGTYLADGGTNLRELNRTLHWDLPTDGPKTLNGLILETMQAIPKPGTSLELHGYPIAVVKTRGTAVQTVRIDPTARRRTDEEA